MTPGIDRHRHRRRSVADAQRGSDGLAGYIVAWLFEFHVAMGAGQIRIAGEVPHPGNGGRFEGWDRYESAVNTIWQDFPVWGRCLYDTTTAPQAVLDAVERTHTPASCRRRESAGPAAATKAPWESKGLGLGLWAMRHLDIDVALRHTDDGFTVRLRSGTTPG
jgi:MEDS: MEthanogen/methylotroph, DcmR Sensory domain